MAIAAGHYGIATHFSSGLETPLVQIWAALLCLWLLYPRSRILQVLAGISPLIRPELTLAVLIIGVFIFFACKSRPWIFGVSTAVFCGSWLMFRIYYYADLLPNTYYLKAETLLTQGLWYLANGAVNQWWLVIIPTIWLMVFLLRRNLSSVNIYPRIVMLFVALTMIAWVVRIGGDMTYFRFLAGPTTFILCSIAGVAEVAIFRWVSPKRFRRLFGYALVICAFILSVMSYPPQLLGHPLSDPEATQWHKIESAFWHRRHGQLSPSPKRPALDTELLVEYSKITEAERQHQEVLVHPWCRRAFFDFTKYIVHRFGLTDSILAHTDAPMGRAGHKLVSRYAYQIAEILRWSKLERRPGVYRKAAESGLAAGWIRKNLRSIEVLERKIYNRHDFWENLKLSFKKPKLIVL